MLPRAVMPLIWLLSFLWVDAACAQSKENKDSDTLEIPFEVKGDPLSQDQLANVVSQIVSSTNQFRESEDLRALKTDQALTEAAQYFADYMARTSKYGHHADGQRPAERAQQHGYDYCLVLENIGYAAKSRGYQPDDLAHEFVSGWKQSKGHRENMLDPYIFDTGVAVARSEETGVYMAVQMFGRPRSEQIEFQIQNETGDLLEYTLTVQGEEGGKTFQLPPRVSRTHQRCRPAAFRFAWMDSPQAVDSGTQYQVQATGAESYRIEQAELAAP